MLADDIFGLHQKDPTGILPFGKREKVVPEIFKSEKQSDLLTDKQLLPPTMIITNTHRTAELPGQPVRVSVCFVCFVQGVCSWLTC